MLAPGIWQYFFRSEEPLDFVPGQYASLHLPGVMHDPRGSARTFSLTSLPGTSCLSFVVKHFDLQTPYKHRLQALHPNEPARLDHAMGDLVLPKHAGTPLVFVAGGIGIASFISMFQKLIEQREERPIFLYYSLRSSREHIFRNITDSYPLQLKQVILAPNRLRAQEIKDTTPPNALIYLSGSQRFVEGIHADLTRLGTPHEHIIFDYFDGYTQL